MAASEVILGKFNAVARIHYQKSRTQLVTNRTFINLEFLLASPYRLNHWRESYGWSPPQNITVSNWNSVELPEVAVSHIAVSSHKPSAVAVVCSSQSTISNAVKRQTNSQHIQTGFPRYDNILETILYIVMSQGRITDPKKFICI
jgi:hypothetical protein